MRGTTDSREALLARHGVAEDYIHQTMPIPYDDRGMQDDWQKEVYQFAAEHAALHSFSTIVDVGCGSGFKLMQHFSRYSTVGFEIEPTLSYLRAEYPDREWREGSLLTPSSMDVDLVICSDVIEHLADPTELLRKMACSKAKAICISTPALEIVEELGWSPPHGPPGNPAHVREWTIEQFAEYVGCYLPVTRHWVINHEQATQMIFSVR